MGLINWILSLALLFSLSFSWASKTEEAWMPLAQQLRSEETRNKALSDLQKIQNLEAQLETALHIPSLRSLALVVIRNLKLRTFSQKLSSQLSNDHDGEILQTILKLELPTPSPQITATLKKLWEQSEKLSNDHKILLLSLPSHDFPLSSELFHKWLQSEDYELRIALAQRAVENAKKSEINEQQWLAALNASPYQVRWELIASAKEIKNLPLSIQTEITKRCKMDSRPEIQNVCRNHKGFGQ